MESSTHSEPQLESYSYTLSILSLPHELILNEIFLRLDIKDLLSFCRSNHASMTLATTSGFFSSFFRSLNYRDAQHSLLVWAQTGVMIRHLLFVLPSLFPLLDVRTVSYVYNCFLEQRRDEDALWIKNEAIKHYESKSVHKVGLRYFAIDSSAYDHLRELLRAIKELQSLTEITITFRNLHPYSFYKDKSRVFPFYEREYNTFLILSALDDDELVAFYRHYGDNFRTSSIHRCLLSATIYSGRIGLLLNDSIVKPLIKGLGRCTVKDPFIHSVVHEFNRYWITYRLDYNAQRILERLATDKDFNIVWLMRLVDPEDVATTLKQIKRDIGPDIKRIKQHALEFGYTLWLSRLQSSLASK